MKLSLKEMRDYLNEKVVQYNRPDFIPFDPISIPHSFSKKEDIEISAFLAATISWGNRKSIVTNANRIMDLMDRAPYDFILNHKTADLRSMKSFVHRTFNGEDLDGFVKCVRHLYSEYGGLEQVFFEGFEKGEADVAISFFREKFFEGKHAARTEKHVSNPLAGSSAKRLNMYLRWMVRNDQAGVDFGIWKKISPSKLSLPLDVHTGNVGRTLGLLSRTQNDWKAVAEIDQALRTLDPKDPIKYDFALFGIGVSGELN